jgi:hypothetical protein
MYSREIVSASNYLQVFHQTMPFYTSNTWLSRPNPKVLSHLAQCRIVSYPQSVWELLAEGNPVTSGRVTLLNNCGPHRHLITFFTKQKLFLLKS